MAETLMEHRVDNRLEKLLRGRTEGRAVALRGCTDEQEAALRERFGAKTPGRVRLIEPCRTEHPHSAFLRKSIEKSGHSVLQTTLYAPGGRLTEERTADGGVLEYFVKKPQDFEVLRGFLRDVDLLPARTPARPGCAADVACMNLTPVRELETRWAGPEMTRWALAGGDESAASCLRKLERQLHRRAEEACRAGCAACALRDMAAEPLPETYMLQAGRHVEWLRHGGLPPYVEALEPIGPLLAALCAAGAGARVSLSDPALAAGDFAPPDGMRILIDVDAGEGQPDPEYVKRLLDRCGSTVMLVDCFGAEASALEEIVGLLMGLCQ